MTNDVSFTDMADVVTPEIQDDETEKLKRGVYESVEKEQLKKEIKTDMGINSPPSESESVPPELPKMLFSAGSKVIGCERFKLESDESDLMAKHLSNLIGAQNSKLYSLFIIIVITISKVGECWGKAKRMLGGKKSKDTEFDEETESTTPVYG